jgi:acyl-CoA synthetase (NDP forming)
MLVAFPFRAKVSQIDDRLSGRDENRVAGILHKTEAGGVVVGANSDDEAKGAYEKILSNAKQYKADARIDGVQIQQRRSQ